MSSDIEYYTRLAREKLHMRQDDDAISHFQKALKCAKKSANTQHVCKCMFNLGAALVALHRTPEGLKYLESVVPLKHDHKLTGDLWYNLCLAHEDLDNVTEALKYIKKAIESYSESSDDILLKAGSACRLASLYRQLQESEKAAEAYADAADSYRIANDVPQQAVCLLQQARLFACCKKGAEGIVVADQCVKLCSELPDAGLDIGQLLNDVGLFYAQLTEYQKALSCFEQVQKIFQRSSKHQKLEAVILQNIGAICNCLMKYDKSIDYNRQAAEIYAQLNCRNEQGQCFSNMAYAFSQLPDIDKASELYLHALQAAKDTGDRKCEYQALEGLSAVAFQQQKYERSRDCLKNALLAVSADSSGQSSAAQQRICNKLESVMQTKLNLDNQHTVQRTPTTTEEYRPLVPTDYMINTSACNSNSNSVHATQDAQHRQDSDSDEDESSSSEDSDSDDNQEAADGEGKTFSRSHNTGENDKSRSCDASQSQACVMM